MTLEQRLSRLEAIHAINELIGDLGRAFDSGPSAAMLQPLFADAATFKIDTYGVLEGAAAIAAGVAGNASRGFKWTLHYLVSPKIDLSKDGTTADVEFMLWETATAASGRAYWIGGRYVARTVSNQGRWQFDRLELRADLISHYPAGWVAKPDTLADA